MKEFFAGADWIFVKDFHADVCNTYFDYRAEFHVDKKEKVKLYISASTLYAVYVNGQFVECGQYADYEDYQVYDEMLLDSYLSNGKNVLEIVQYVVGTDFSTHRIQKPGVIFAVWQEDNCLLNSNTDILSRKNVHYHSGTMEKVSVQLGYTFKYDACAEKLPFRKSVLAGKEKNLQKRPIKKLIIEEATVGMLKTQGVFLNNCREKPIGEIMHEAYLSTRKAGALLDIDDESIKWHVDEDDMAEGVYFIVDAGQETVGFLNLDVDVPEECDIYIGYGEHLEDMRVRTFVNNRNFCALYHAHAGRNRFFNPFLRMGMRYLQIHISSKKGILYKAGVRNCYYPLNIKEAGFKNPLHHKIYDVGVRTLHMCMHEHYEDCPWREQALYTFDSCVQMLCGYYAFGEFEFARESLRLIAHSLREDNMLELCSPGKVRITIPSFTAVFIRQLKEYLDYSKDVVFIRQMYDMAKRIVDGFARRVDDTGLIPCYQGKGYWNFYEWRKGLHGKEYFEQNPPYECPLNAFVSDAFWCFARICDVVCPENAAYYDNLHIKLNEAIHKSFFDEQRGIYITRLNGDSEQLHALTQAMALYVEATPEHLKDTVVKNMLGENMIPCSLSASIYEYDVLLQMGEIYRDYVREKVETVWGEMLYAGATTFWETEGGASDFKNAGSLCHGWSAVPIYLYGKYNLMD